MSSFIADASVRPPDPNCPKCSNRLTYIESEISAGLDRPQAGSLSKAPVHYYYCRACGKSWALGRRLISDEIGIARGRSGPPMIDGDF